MNSNPLADIPAAVEKKQLEERFKAFNERLDKLQQETAEMNAHLANIEKLLQEDKKPEETKAATYIK